MRAVPVLLASIGGLVFAGLAVLPWLEAPPEPAGASAIAASAAIPARPWWLDPLPDLAALEMTTRRPLFERTRRPPPKGPGIPLAAVDPALALGKYRIDGVVVSEEDRIAVVTDVSQGKLMTLREGQTLEGWQVETVGLDGLALRRGTERLSIPVGAQRD